MPYRHMPIDGNFLARLVALHSTLVSHSVGGWVGTGQRYELAYLRGLQACYFVNIIHTCINLLKSLFGKSSAILMFEAQPWLLRGQLEAQPARPSHAALIEFYPSFDMPNIEEDSRRSQSSNSKVELTLWSNKGRYGAARAAKNKWVKLKAEVQLVSPRPPSTKCYFFFNANFCKCHCTLLL